MTQPLQVTIAQGKKANTTVVSLAGDFDSTAKEHLAALEKHMAMAAAEAHYIFDLSQLRFLNSYAIGQLVGWHNALEPKKGKIMIVGANPNVAEIFAIVGVDHLFETHPTMEEALKKVG